MAVPRLIPGIPTILFAPSGRFICDIGLANDLPPIAFAAAPRPRPDNLGLPPPTTEDVLGTPRGLVVEEVVEDPALLDAPSLTLERINNSAVLLLDAVADVVAVPFLLPPTLFAFIALETETFVVAGTLETSALAAALIFLLRSSAKAFIFSFSSCSFFSSCALIRSTLSSTCNISALAFTIKSHRSSNSGIASRSTSSEHNL
mmetsp:Transcript_2169/g.3988  ORF Transcript_2169/g.3988 Transcript_2169/m.3988 type:complete len:203 (-) Transcript_2169:869-1477(-)